MKELGEIKDQEYFQYEKKVEKLLSNIINEKRNTKISLDELSKSIEDLNHDFLDKYSRQERKQAGSFYTNEAIVQPTVERTLIPFVYQKKQKIVPPERILELKILDPAVGCFPVFLIVAVKVLSQLLYESMVFHGFFEVDSTSKYLKIHSNELLTFLSIKGYTAKSNDNLYNKKLISSILRLLITQNCIYGVDIDPVAVKLAKLNMIAVIGDISFDFKFLDNNIKAGNSLISCWSNSFLRYPANSSLKESLGNIKTTITENTINIHPFYWTDRKEKVMKEIRETESFCKVNRYFDTWCSTWFWPLDTIEKIPKIGKNFNMDKNDERVISRLKKELRFFHWELEFPEVFFRDLRGFDAILGNPPWETVKPHSREFFAKYDKGFWKYGKQEALKQQINLFNDKANIEKEWLNYKARMKSTVNYFRNSAGKLTLNNTNTFSTSPYQMQGTGNLNNYRLFTELALRIVNNRGRLGIILPAGIYSDLGSTALRKYLMDHTQWEWLFGFENKHGIFPDIHRSYKFCILITAFGGSTELIKASFNCQNIDDWANQNLKFTKITVKSIKEMSPENRIISEINTENDATILQKIHCRSILLKESSLKYVREYDMTNHSKLFPPIHSWKKNGYSSTRYGYWENKEGKRAFPLYEGRMVGQFQFSKKGWIEGKGRTAIWREIKDRNAVIEPQYLMSAKTHEKKGNKNSKHRIAFIHVTATTNRRSMICSLNHCFPHGNSAPFFVLNDKKPEITIASLFYVAYFNSYCFDYALRLKLTGINLNWFILAECPLINHENVRKDVVDRISLLTARLNLNSAIYSPVWMYLRKRLLLEENYGKLWANTLIERIRLRTILDGIFAYILELSIEELAWILRHDNSNIKGFWRVDSTLPEHIRHPSLVLIFYQELKEEGIDWKWENWNFPAEINKDIVNSQERNEEADSESYDWNKCEEQSKMILGPEIYSKLVKAINKDKDPFMNII